MALFNTNTFYRLHPSTHSSNISLDNDNDGMPNGFTTLSVTPSGTYSGQYWQITNTSHSSESLYQLCASFLGPEWRLGYWVTTDTTPPTYYPGLFANQPRDAAGQQWDIAMAGTDKDGEELYEIKNQQTAFYMDLGSLNEQGNYGIYLGGNRGNEVSKWRIEVVGLINNAAYSPLSGATSAMVTATGSSTTTEDVPTGSLPSSSSATSTSAISPETLKDGHHTNPLALLVGTPIGAVVLILLLVVTWSIYRRRKLGGRKDTEVDAKNKGSQITADAGAGPGTETAIYEFYQPDSKTHTDNSHEIAPLSPLAPPEDGPDGDGSTANVTSPRQRTRADVISPTVASRLRSIDIDEIGPAELEGDDVMTRRGIREV